MPISEDEYRKLIKDTAREYATFSHQSKDKELSGIVSAFDVKLTKFIATIETRAVKWDLTTQVVFALIGLIITAVVVALISIVVT